MVGELVQYQLLIRAEKRCPELGFKTSGEFPQSYILLPCLQKQKVTSNSYLTY